MILKPSLVLEKGKIEESINAGFNIVSDVHAHLGGFSEPLHLSRFHIADIPTKEDVEQNDDKDDGGNHSNVDGVAGDDDIDSSPKRRKINRRPPVAVTIYHSNATSIESVGMQLWRGAFLLADYLLHTKDSWANRVVVECGAGCGFIGVILSMTATGPFFITDYAEDLCALASRNLALNGLLCGRYRPSLVGRDNSALVGSVGVNKGGEVRHLDWFAPFSPRTGSNTAADRENVGGAGVGRGGGGVGSGGSGDVYRGKFGWTDEDCALLSSADTPVMFVASDVMYDDVLTEAFFVKLDGLMRSGEELWLTLEKRFNFSLSELAVVAHGYCAFLKTINSNSNHLSQVLDDDDDLTGMNHTPATTTAITATAADAASITTTTTTTATVTAAVTDATTTATSEVFRMPSGRAFRGEQMPLSFPQRVLGYERVDGLELWRITIS